MIQVWVRSVIYSHTCVYEHSVGMHTHIPVHIALAGAYEHKHTQEPYIYTWPVCTKTSEMHKESHECVNRYVHMYTGVHALKVLGI